MKEYTIYYKGFRKIKAYTREGALSEAIKNKKPVKELYIQGRKTLFFDCFIDNFPFLINITVWFLLIVSIIDLIKLADVFEYKGLKIIYLMTLLMLLIRLPLIGRSVGKIYNDMIGSVSKNR